MSFLRAYRSITLNIHCEHSLPFRFSCFFLFYIFISGLFRAHSIILMKKYIHNPSHECSGHQIEQAVYLKHSRTWKQKVSSAFLLTLCPYHFFSLIGFPKSPWLASQLICTENSFVDLSKKIWLSNSSITNKISCLSTYNTRLHENWSTWAFLFALCTQHFVLFIGFTKLSIAYD